MQNVLSISICLAGVGYTNRPVPTLVKLWKAALKLFLSNDMRIRCNYILLFTHCPGGMLK